MGKKQKTDDKDLNVDTEIAEEELFKFPQWKNHF